MAPKRRKIKTRIVVRFFLLLAGAVVLSALGCRSFPSETKLKILHLNDVHSFLAPQTAELTFEGQSTICEVGGMARVAGLVDALAVKPAQTLLLHAGDAVQGTLYFTLFDGRADAGVMNVMPFDAMALGNHEFDNRDSWLAGFIRSLKVPVVSANIRVDPGHVLEHLFAPYVVKKIDGRPVGIIGMTISEVTRRSSRPGPGVLFGDEVRYVQAAVDELSAKGIGRIILLSHYGYENILSLAGQVSDVDVIVDGHSHTLLGDLAPYGLACDSPYPVISENKEGDPVCIVQAWSHGRVLGELDVRFKGDRLAAWSGRSHLVLGDQFWREGATGERQRVTGAEREKILDRISRDDSLDIAPENAAVAGVLDQFSRQVAEKGETIIGTARQDLAHVRVPGQVHGTKPMPLGSRLVPLVAQAFYEQVPHADMCIQNAGGVRTGIQKGAIRYSTVYGMLPFSNTLFEIEMPGHRIRQVLEQALEYVLKNDAKGAFPYAYGLRYDIDARKPFGSRFSGLEVRERVSGRYVPLEDERSYVVVANDFIASGKDGYKGFGAASQVPGKTVNTYLDYARAFITHVQAMDLSGKGLAELPSRDHCIKSFIPPDKPGPSALIMSAI
ncbi:NAD nucleotidase [Desulfobacter hydrogenophilus]|uniref:NAD nucleotidase n=1 Tax=Desulfobacter hydrogenophilus TaxID=2291 RepID=A0A328F9X7_9BACT|nr:5'-nucleotidase C-terminal domain-containing protein [Desulfobacter hydrogenophilus]NDY72882.1 NAD nucleotidase [Desulfobacter hydrogenophilus]QBH11797.1 NAD nucleotidase [Desulfobacter hydrogenophilus]RAM01026.1 NAD nucleotidase [Desulfobacter hydrogenophilus]